MNPRRDLLKYAAAAAALVAAPARAQERRVVAPAAPTPNEDLMQEHGLVSRVILIYRRSIELAEANRPFHPEQVAGAARVIARVIHGHHEVEEEELMFPALEKPRELHMLVEVLRGQHRAARALTNRIGLEIADPGRRSQAFRAMREFSGMYEAHGAYENSIVYPAFRQAVGPERYQELAAVWAKNERKLRGSLGDYLSALAKAEQAMDLDLAQYTGTPASARGGS